MGTRPTCMLSTTIPVRTGNPSTPRTGLTTTPDERPLCCRLQKFGEKADLGGVESFWQNQWCGDMCTLLCSRRRGHGARVHLGHSAVEASWTINGFCRSSVVQSENLGCEYCRFFKYCTFQDSRRKLDTLREEIFFFRNSAHMRGSVVLGDLLTIKRGEQGRHSITKSSRTHILSCSATSI